MPEQTIFTLGQAAKAAGKSKTAVSNAIKSGRLSTMGKEGGSYQISASELFRVYPVTGNVNSKSEQHVTPNNDNVDSALQAEISGLREQVNLLASERDDLRGRLDAESAERRKLTALLTDQRQQETRGFWVRVFGRK